MIAWAAVWPSRSSLLIACAAVWPLRPPCGRDVSSPVARARARYSGETPCRSHRARRDANRQRQASEAKSRSLESADLSPIGQRLHQVDRRDAAILLRHHQANVLGDGLAQAQDDARRTAVADVDQLHCQLAVGHIQHGAGNWTSPWWPTGPSSWKDIRSQFPFGARSKSCKALAPVAG